MIEYLHSAIKATPGEDVEVIANIAEDGADITEGCGFMLHLENEMINVEGNYFDGLWHFIIPGEHTKGLMGRYWYCITKDGNTLCFKQPIYFI